MPIYTGQTTGTQEGDIKAGYLANGTYLKPGSEITTPFTGTISNPISSTTETRNNVTNLSNDISNLSNTSNTGPTLTLGGNGVWIDKNGKPLDDATLKQYLAGEKTSTTNQIPTPPVRGQYSAADLKSIEGAGTGAGSEYDSLIAKAQRDKTQGMAKNIVAAGEKGGFMNSQFSGIAAQTPIKGGGFVGAGGELERIQSEYDFNIQDLEAKKLAAIEKAKSDMETYIDKGKQQDYENAHTAYKDAADAEEAKQKAITDKAKAVADAQKASFDLTVPLGKAGDKVREAGVKIFEDHPDIVQTLLDLGGSPDDLNNMNLNELTYLATQTPSYKAAQFKAALGPGSIGEFQYYSSLTPEERKQYDQYQTIDANRKARATAAAGGLTPGQVTAFNNIANKYNSSPLILAADRTAVLKGIIKDVKSNPKNGASQLSLAYGYVQALDTYQSAVREGELGLVNSIDSKIGQLANSVEKIQNGQIVRPDVAIQIADTAQKLVDTINDAAKMKAQSYKSQANVIGLGPTWDQYTAGFTPGYENKQTITIGGKEYNVGETVTNSKGQKGTVNADGTITPI